MAFLSVTLFTKYKKKIKLLTLAYLSFIYSSVASIIPSRIRHLAALLFPLSIHILRALS